VTARDALAIGLVDRVVPRARLREAATEEAHRIARNPLPGLLAVRRAARAVPCLDARAAIEYELGLTAGIVAEGAVKATLREYARRVGILKE
jgi:enoyl-CoA hydratase/carnithine racemase